MTINAATANNGDGGVFHLANSGTNTISFTTPTFFTAYASQNGGIFSIAGTSVSITMTTMSVSTCRANAGNGGGIALTNSGGTTISVATGSIATWSRA